jgi:hypothetical protein
MASGSTSFLHLGMTSQNCANVLNISDKIAIFLLSSLFGDKASSYAKQKVLRE